MVMDAKVKSMNEDLAKNEKSLQVCVACFPVCISAQGFAHLLLLSNHDLGSSQHCLLPARTMAIAMCRMSLSSCSGVRCRCMRLTWSWTA